MCLAIDNGSELDDIQPHSFRAPDGTCLVYKGGWGLGDTVGRPDVFVKAPHVNDVGVLVNAYPPV